MPIIGNFLVAVTTVLRLLMKLVILLIFIRTALTWINPGDFNIDPTQRFIMNAIDETLDPLLEPVRVMLPITRTLGIDVSPLFAILGLWFFDIFILGTIQQYATRLKSSHV